MESEQDRKTYRESGKNTGISLGYDISSGKVSGFVSAGKSRTDSDYESVTGQAGIYAGDKGFDISVKNNTHLKGAVIDSKGDAEKNTLRTGTLSWEDVENKADYKAGGMGISYNPKDSTTPLNARGLTPQMSPTVKDKAGSTTKAAIAKGTIVITDKKNQGQDISTLHRDTENSLNRLKEIFDKSKVEEKQELLGMIEKYGNQAIHAYAESRGWKDGSAEKVLLHGAFGALMGDMGTGETLAGALSSGINEYVMGYLNRAKSPEWVRTPPDAGEWLSAGLGTVIGKVSDASISGMAGISLNAAKWNRLAYERLTLDSVKKALIKKDGKQMTDKEIVGLLNDIVEMVKEKDPQADMSKYWEYGNKDTEKAVVICLEKHGISGNNIEKFMRVYKETYITLAEHDIRYYESSTRINLDKQDSLGLMVSTLPGILVIANRNTANWNNNLLEEGEHSDWYEAKLDLERNLREDLKNTRQSLGTKIAVEHPTLSKINYGMLKSVGLLGAEWTAIVADTPIAAKFLIHGLTGTGDMLSFKQGSYVSKNIENSEILSNKVNELSQNVRPEE